MTNRSCQLIDGFAQFSQGLSQVADLSNLAIKLLMLLLQFIQ